MDSQKFSEATIARTPASEAELVRFARGSWQESCITGNRIALGDLRGKAGDYRQRYERSMANMLARIEESGYRIEPVTGPRGGRPREWRVYRQ